MTANKSNIVAHQFKPGQPRPPTSGRKVGGPREKVGYRFVKAIQKEFEEHGEEVIRIARIEQPVEFLKLVAKVGRIDAPESSGAALVKISINRFFDDKPEAVTIDGVSVPNDDLPPE
jgi:hypothetical protein